MNERQYNFSRFRMNVLDASSVLLDGREKLEARQRKLPLSNAGVQAEFIRTLSDQEACVLSSLVLVSALKILEAGHNLGTLFFDRRSSGNGHGKAINLRLCDLPQLSKELYGRFDQFCPQWLLPAVPAPDQIDKTQWEVVWKQLNDPGISSNWLEESSLGYVYQFYCTPLRRESQDCIQSSNKSLTLRRLVSFTQLYTPNWVVDFLLQNTLLPQWSGPIGPKDFRYLIRQQESLTGQKAPHLKLIDPACGSGHFILRAFDLFLYLYRIEGWSAPEAIPYILKENLSGVDIDPVALWITAFSLMLKGARYGIIEQCNRLQLSHVQSEARDQSALALLGSLSPHWTNRPEHPLSRRYHSVVTNPPYIGRKLLDRRLKDALRAHYPDCYQDLCAAFLRRGLDLLCPGGRLGLIGQASLMFLPTYGDLRKHLVEDTNLVSVVEAGPGVFPLQGGEKVNSALFVIESRNELGKQGLPALAEREFQTVFYDVVSQVNKEQHLKELMEQGGKEGVKGLYVKQQASFKRHRRYSFNYKCPSLAMDIMESCKRLGEVADLRQGLATSDNERFVRYRWQVDPDELGVRWIPYVKGAGSERWWAPIEHVVDWQDNGAAIKRAVAEAYPYLNSNTAWVVKNERFYFREGLTFSFVNSRRLAVRKLPPGCIFDVGGSAIFAAAEDLDFLLGYLNSSFVASIAKLLNPTINFQVGDLKQLPILPFDPAIMSEISGLAQRCCALKQFFYEPLMPLTDENRSRKDIDTTSGGAGSDKLRRVYSTNHSAASLELAELEERIDKIVIETLLVHCGNSSAAADLLGWIEETVAARKPASRLSGSTEGIA